MKPCQPARTEGYPIQHNASCVTGNAWRTDCHVRGGRVTTERSAVVTRPQSGAKCERCVKILDVRPTAGGITARLLNKNFQFSNDNVVWPAYTGRTFWFYPRPLRQSGNQGTVGS